MHAAYAGHPTTAAWIIRRVTGIPFSVSSHAHDLFETQALLPEKLPEAAFVRTISQFNRDFILRHVPALAERPPEVVHVGNHLGERVAREAGDGSVFRVLYVGSLESRKGVDLLLKAVARMAVPSWRLDIVGDGPEAGRLRRQVAELGLSQRVTFHGRQRNEEVQRWMRGSSLLVVPSRIGPRNQTEGLPTVIVEAFSVELPVVATRLTGIPEIVRPDETGLLFEMEDVSGLTAALERVHANPGLAANWARKGRELVEAEFDQIRNARQLLDLVLAVDARKTAGPMPPVGQKQLPDVGPAPQQPLPPMRILLVATRDPRGRMTGRKMVLQTILQSLTTLGNSATVAHFGPAEGPTEEGSVRYRALTNPGLVERLLKCGVAFTFGRRSLSEALYDGKVAHREVGDLLSGEPFGLVITDMIRTAAYGDRSGLPWIADLDDLLSDRYRRLASNDMSGGNLLGYLDSKVLRGLVRPLAALQPMILRREAHLLAKRERMVAGSANLATLVNPSEAASLAQASGRPVAATPMSVAGPAEVPTPHRRLNELIFLGGLDYGPNLSSLRQFDRQVRPCLESLGLEDIKLHVVGHAAPQHRRGFSEAITFRGYVDDLDGLLQTCSAMLVPELAAGGVKTKIIVAALNGTVVLCHRSALLGMSLVDRREVLAWSTPKELAELIAQLRGSEIDVRTLVRQAHEWATNNYSPERLRELWQRNIAYCMEAGSIHNHQMSAAS